MRKFLMAAALVVASLFWGAAAHACNVPNPNLNAPPFVDGCPVPASALNNLARTSPPVINPLAYGAKCDGSTDDTAALQSALNAATALGGQVAWPSQTCYSATGVTAAAPLTIQGVSFGAHVPVTGSVLECPNSIGSCLKVTGGSGNLQPVTIDNLTVYGLGTTPAGNSKGIWQSQGAMVSWHNVASVNWDTCIEFQSSSSAGIRFVGQSVYTGACQTHAWVSDGWPEMFVNGGAGDVAGSNSAAFTAQNDFIYGTNTSCTTGGCGPNTIGFQNYNFITNGGVSCFMNIGGISGSAGGIIGEFRFTDDHVEFHDAASAPQGLFCTDSSVPLLQDLYVTNMVTSTFQTGGASGAFMPLFHLNSNTAVKEVHFSNGSFDNCFYTSSPNMALLDPTPVSGSAVMDVHFDHNDLCGGLSVTSNGVGTNTFYSSGNASGPRLIAGAWSDLESFGDNETSPLTDTATGNVAIGKAIPVTFTPALEFCNNLNASCSSTGITYSTDTGSYTRTADGGFTINFDIVLAGNTAGSGASSAIGNLPSGLACAAQYIGNASVPFASGFASASIVPPVTAYFNPNTTPSQITLGQGSTTATTAGQAIPYSAWVTNTTIIGSIHCAHTT